MSVTISQLRKSVRVRWSQQLSGFRTPIYHTCAHHDSRGCHFRYDVRIRISVVGFDFSYYYLPIWCEWVKSCPDPVYRYTFDKWEKFRHVSFILLGGSLIERKA